MIKKKESRFFDVDEKVPGAEEVLIAHELHSRARVKIQQMLDRLTVRERFIARVRTMCNNPMTLDTTGYLLGISGTRTRDIEQTMLGKFRQWLSMTVEEFDETMQSLWL